MGFISFKKHLKKIIKKILINKPALIVILKKIATNRHVLPNLIRVIFQRILIRLRREKNKHLIICGCSRSGTTLFYNMLIYSNNNGAFAPKKEMSALNTLHFYKKN